MQSYRSLRSFFVVGLGIGAFACGTESKDADPYTQTDSSISSGDACDGKPVGSIERRVRFQAASVKADAMCVPQDQMRSCNLGGVWTAWTGDYSIETCAVEGLASCEGMPHGTTQMRARYEAMTVPADQTCKKQDQTRACEDGTWSDWSGSYTSEGCTVETTQSCGTSPDGANEKRKRFEKTEVPFGELCKEEEQSRDCKMGTWSSWTGTFTQEACIVKNAESCGNVPHGTTVKRDRWQKNLVEANETCDAVKEEQSATCNNGELTWSGTFTEVKCEIKGQRSCGDTLHSQTQKRTLFEAASVDFGKECVSVEQTRLCADSVFGEWTPVSTFTATECKPKDPASCGSVPHNGTRTRLAYKDASPDFGKTCESATQTSTCGNGTWSDYVGPDGYAALTCKVKDPKPCGSVAHGATTTRKFYENTSVPFGTTCKSQDQTGTCSDGTLTFPGPYTAETCTVAPAESCEGVAAGTIEKRERFEKASVPAGSTCRSQEQSRTCTNTKWTAWTPSTYTELTCKVLLRSCSLGFGGGPDILDGESESRVRYEAAFPVTCKQETQTRRCNDGTFAAWSGTFKAVGCAPQLAPAAGVASCRTPRDSGARCREWTGPQRNSNESSCAGAGNWDATRGCPTGGTTVGKCSGDLGAGPTADFHYDDSAGAEISSCKLGITGTWTDL